MANPASVKIIRFFMKGSPIPGNDS
jgi:hypothetical protein